LATLKIVSSHMVFLVRQQTSNKVELHEEYQVYLSLKFDTQAQPFTSLSKVCISQALECQSLWIIDSAAFDHIFGNASLFSSISYPKFPHVITLANGSALTSQRVGQVSLSPS